MSSDSETTTSSKLRQFGLYRTIDARTEEFLKLSRRRQIRQGCACAAVSTAITVTVVVSVLLVYEYGFHAEPGLGPRHRPHWLTMLNDTDAFDNIQKNSFNVNRNTIKLIPILLKAIKQNRYLEAVLDDYPSQTPANDKDTTDYPLERNIFTDARNWIRTPTSRLYAIEYKSTPLIINHLFKTRNRDDFARSAKIMNSQRVKSYIDRMINDRVGYTPSDSQMAYDINIIPTIPPKRIALPYTRSKEQQDRVKQSSTKQSKEIKKLNCKCNNVGDILRKLLNTIQQLLPENEMCSNGNFLCGGSKLTTTTQKNTVRKSQLAKIVSRPGTEYKNIIKGDMAMNFRKLPKPSFEPKHKFLRKSNSLKNMISSMTSMQNKVPQNNISKKLLPKNKNILPSGNQNLDPGMVYISPGLTSDDTTTIRSYIEPTEEFDKEHTTTKPMMSSIKVNKDHRVKNHEQEVNESDLVDAYVSEAPTTISQPTTKPKQLQKLFNYGKDATRTRNQLDNLMQKIKTNKPSISKLHKYSQIEPHKSFPIKHQESSEWTPKLSKNKVRKIKDKRKKKMTNETEALDHFIYNATESFQPTEISSKNSSFIQVSSIDDVQTVENGFSEHQDYEHNFDENIYWSHEEDQKTRKNATIRQFQQKLDESNKNNLNYFDRSKILPAQSVQIPTKNHNVHTHVLPKLEEIFDTLTDFADARFNSTHGFYPGALAKNSAESLNPLKSMIPKSRPQFLEIRRKDVKQEGHDYDEDLNVILLIYEYAIAVESSLVQTILDSYGNGTSLNGTEDNPVADRLDRSDLGFDQDYYERMPLLVNAMQENHYVDPILEMSFPAKRARVLKNKTTTTTNDYRTTSIRRTSPRPFIFEYRSPTPTPFGKTFGSKTWVESYRNAQRLQNLQQVIQYLEKTINAKFGDLYALPSSTHIAFSGVYVHPSPTKPDDIKATSPTLDLLLQSSNKIETRINHVSDPLFSFKPDNPSDVNLLADNIFRFAPTSATVIDKQTTVPMFRSISNRKKHDNKDKNVVDLLQGASEIKNIEPPTVDKPNSFSVMLNYVPTKTTINTDYIQDGGTSSSINKVYFTTSRPVKFHFKRKSSGPIRRMYPPRAIRRPISRSFNSPVKVSKPESTKETTMIVHVNLYPQKTEVIDVRNMTEPKHDYTSTTTASVPDITPQMTQTPEISIAGIEDHHDGSSGVIPVEARTYPPSPPPAETTPYFETTVSSTEVYTWSTSPPDIIKFSPEDAKVPDKYMDFRKIDVTESPIQITRRKFRDSIEMHEDVEPSTLVVKLKNELKTTTQESITIPVYKEDSEELTTEQTYVPQINGHYRSVNLNSKIINDWFDKDEERKKNLEKIVTGIRRPTYVEIRRNNTKTSHKNDDDDDNDDDEDKT